MRGFLCELVLGLTFVSSFGFAQTEELDFLRQFISEDAEIYEGALPPYGFAAPLPDNSELVLTAWAEMAGSSVIVRVNEGLDEVLKRYDDQLKNLNWQRFDRVEGTTYCKEAGYGILVQSLEATTRTAYLLLKEEPFGAGQFCFYHFEK